MVEISATLVKDLRERSGAAMMDCKKALVDASGDFEKAFELLRQKGVAAASKKAGRSTSEGLVVGQLSDDGRQAALIEINCETDFVARNEEFQSLAQELAQLALQKQPKDMNNLLTAPYKSGTVNDLMAAAIAKTGENIQLKRLATFKLASEYGGFGLYVHALGGKMGALIEINTNKALDKEKLASIGRELAMHVVSAKPQYISREQVPQLIIDEERRIELGKADLADKKPEIREKIVTGRVDKIFSERCLLDQPFVKDPNVTVAKYLAQKSVELGAELKPGHFVIFILGEEVADTNGKTSL